MTVVVQPFRFLELPGGIFRLPVIPCFAWLINVVELRNRIYEIALKTERLTPSRIFEPQKRTSNCSAVDRRPFNALTQVNRQIRREFSTSSYHINFRLVLHLQDVPLFIRTFLPNSEWVVVLPIFGKVISTMTRLGGRDVCDNQVEFIHLASIEWDNLPFRLAQYPYPHGEYHRRLATYVASGLKVLSQQDGFRFVESIRFGFLGSCKEAFDIELTLAPGKGGDETLHIADVLVQSLDIDGLPDLHLTVISNSWRYTAMLYD
jgi:hypothetical protein